MVFFWNAGALYVVFELERECAIIPSLRFELFLELRLRACLCFFLALFGTSVRSFLVAFGIVASPL